MTTVREDTSSSTNQRGYKIRSWPGWSTRPGSLTTAGTHTL